MNEGSGITTVTNHRDYETFGTRLSETNSAVDLIFGFTGRLLDETTGLQDNWHRPYDSLTGSWPTPDPTGFDAGDDNLSRYVGNHPTYATDPNGLEEKEAWHHVLVKAYLRSKGLIDKHGNTTRKVTGGKLNVHAKDHGVLLAPDAHTRRPDGIHCRDSDGGTGGMTYDKHFAREVEKRMKNGTISLEDLKAAGEATKARYPEQFSSSRPATDDYRNRRPLSPKPKRNRRTGMAHLPNPDSAATMAATTLKGSAATLGRTEGSDLAVSILQGALSENTDLLDAANEEFAHCEDMIQKATLRLAGHERPTKYGWWEMFRDYMIVTGGPMNGL